MAQSSSAPLPRRGVVFTDLDGTLLDHRTYDCAPARPALAALTARDIPVVLTSSKTRAEIVAVQQRLGLQGPFIAENGAAVFLTGGGSLAEQFPARLAGLPVKPFGLPYARLRASLAELRTAYGLDITGFGDLGVPEITAWTGLPPDQARLARERDFDEPFRWRPEPDAAAVAPVRSWLDDRGLRLTRGGRFWHLTGPNDKGIAVAWLVAALARAWGARPISLGLGDSENDLPLLAATDEGVLVERVGGGHLAPRPPGLRTVPGVGPHGWNRAVLDWIDRVDAQE